MKIGKNLKVLLFTLVFLLPLMCTANVKASGFGEIDSKDSTEESSDTNDFGVGVMKEYTKGLGVVSEENMEEATGLTKGFVNLLGKAMGVGIIIYIALQGLITVLDFYYVGVAFTRKYLDGSYRGNVAITQQPEGYGGQQPQNQNQNDGHQWVSDEAVKSVLFSRADNLQSAQNMAGGSFNSGMGMGFGRSGYGSNYGGSYGGGYGGQQQQQQPAVQTPNKKLAITIYFKMRTIGLLISFVALFFLTSSLLLTGGINITEAIAKFGAKYIH